MKQNALKALGDEEIIKRIRNENMPDYFEVIYEPYYRKVLDKCYSLVKNRSTALELSEDIFSKGYEKLNSFKNLSSFSSWLYSITFNHCTDYLRDKKKLHYPD